MTTIALKEHIAAPTQAFDSEPPGYLETAVQWVVNKVLRIRVLPAGASARIKLVEQIRSRTLSPVDLFDQFYRYVPRLRRQEIFERLGRNRMLSLRDRMWNWIWRDDAQITKRYREIGKTIARKDPYLLATSLMKALR